MSEHTWTVLRLDETVTEPYESRGAARTFTAEHAGWYETCRDYSRLRTSADFLVDISAPPNSCRRCGIEQRPHCDPDGAVDGGWHPYAAPDDALRLARMKARRTARLTQSRPAEPVPAMYAEIRLDLAGYTAAMTQALTALRNNVLWPARERRRAQDEWLDAQRYLLDAATRLPTRSLVLGPDAVPGLGLPELDWGEPLEAADANWPDDASDVCAHLCGGGHECGVRAVTTLTYGLPSGGKRTMPMCGACEAAESVGGDG